MNARFLVLALSLSCVGACTGADRRSDEGVAPHRAPAMKAVASETPPASEAVPDASVEPSGSYDLAADQERRLRVGREDLGTKAVTAIVSDVFVVVGPAGDATKRFDASVALMRRAMAGFLHDRFGTGPREAITVYLFPNGQTYESFCARKYGAPCIAHFGFYQPNDRSMVMNIGLGLGTLTHEMVHPLVEADFPRAPTWLNEGIASVFEQPIFGAPEEIHGGKNWRYPRLRTALTGAERESARLEGLFTMSDEAFRGDHEDLHYALARYVCQWLDERGKLWPFYRRWRDTIGADPTGAAAFASVVGMSPKDAHPVWSKWVLAL